MRQCYLCGTYDKAGARALPITIYVIWAGTRMASQRYCSFMFSFSSSRAVVGAVCVAKSGLRYIHIDSGN